MTIYQLESVIRALESKDRLDSDDIGFLMHLLENKDNELVKSEILWLQEITEQLHD